MTIATTIITVATKTMTARITLAAAEFLPHGGFGLTGVPVLSHCFVRLEAVHDGLLCFILFVFVVIFFLWKCQYVVVKHLTSSGRFTPSGKLLKTVRDKEKEIPASLQCTASGHLSLWTDNTEETITGPSRVHWFQYCSIVSVIQ